MWLAIAFVGLIVGLIIIGSLRESKQTTIKCKYCGNEFEYSEDEIITYKFSGKLEKCQECPRCHNYINVDP